MSPDASSAEERANPPETEDSDLEYDLAHEAPAQATPEPSAAELVYVATQTEDYDGDYGYDLAHDIPPQAQQPEAGR